MKSVFLVVVVAALFAHQIAAQANPPLSSGGSDARAAPGSAPGQSKRTTKEATTTSTTTTTPAPTTTTTTPAPTSAETTTTNPNSTTEAPTSSGNPANNDQPDIRNLPGSSGTRSRHLLCEGKRSTFSCPIDTYIYIEYAQWGRDNEFTCNATTRNVTTTCDSGSDAVNTMISKCDGLNYCSVDASVNDFGDPCDSRTAMYLVVEFSCKQKLYDCLVCQDSGKLPLTCPKNQVVSTQGAFFGRGNLNTTCPHATAVPTNNCSAEFAPTVFRYLCDGKRDCEVEATTSLFGDPCPESYAYLSATFACEDCTNEEDDIYCEMSAQEGQCDANPDFMIPMCRKACTKCQWETPEADNRWFNDTQCDEWTKNGDCNTNPIWMLAYCKASCLGLNKRTACTNKVTFNNSCTTFENQGECLTNVNWMFPNCTRDCFYCDIDETDVVQCKNRHSDSDQCDQWAAYGECGKNPGFMIPNCLKSCLGCTEDPVCDNIYPDQTCHEWAFLGECGRNAVWMHKNCWKACMQCEGTRECSNQQSDENTCSYWSHLGLISTKPEYMTAECWKTTSGCAGNTEVHGCLNSGESDADCSYWAMIGDCSKRPDELYTSCYKSCTGCDEPDNELTYIGNPPEPGLPEDLTAYRTILLPETFPVYAKLTHFFGYFHNISTATYFQVWGFSADGNFTLKYNQKASPDVAMTSQTVKPDTCVMVEAGDSFGFADFSGTATIGATDDKDGILTPHFYKGSTNSLAFSTLSINKKFSVGAAYSTTETC